MLHAEVFVQKCVTLCIPGSDVNTYYTSVFHWWLCGFQVFPGNQDNSTVVTHALSPKVRHTRYVRFEVMTFNKKIAMRVEVYGCGE